jgi:hypothetical protein
MVQQVQHTEQQQAGQQMLLAAPAHSLQRCQQAVLVV